MIAYTVGQLAVIAAVGLGVSLFALFVLACIYNAFSMSVQESGRLGAVAGWLCALSLIVGVNVGIYFLAGHTEDSGSQCTEWVDVDQNFTKCISREP